MKKESLIIAIALVIMGICLSHGLQTAFGDKQTVFVKGLSEREVEANKVIWPLVYSEVGNNLGDLYTACTRKNDIIVNFLTTNGIAASDITVEAPRVTDLDANQYSSNTSHYRYIVRSCVTVATSDVQLARSLMLRQSELLTKGIAIKGQDYENMVIFEFTGLNSIKPEMIEEATKNARIAGEKFAQDSNCKLGKIKRASQGQFTIEDRDANTPHIKRVRVVTNIDFYLN